jgi:ligand-binding sensor domain-containing protein/signal transduction histidine kinase
MPRLHILAIAFVISHAICAQTQNRDIKFRHLTTAQGLSHDHVQGILRDSEGFMWFATEGGLNKFDGYDFTIFRNNPEDSTSIAENFVSDVIEDKNGNVLVALNNGFDRFDRKKNAFFHFDVKGFSVRDLFEDSKGNLWLGTDGGVFQYDLDKGIIRQFNHADNDPASLSHYLVYEMTEDKDHNIWISTRKGLNKLNPATGHITHYFNIPGNDQSVIDDYIRTVFCDSKGNVWAGTRSSGISRIDPKTNRFTNFKHRDGDPTSLCYNDILTFGEDEYGNIWIGTENGGVDLYDYKTNSFKNYTTKKGDALSISNPSVHYIYAAKTGDIWIGTYAGGANLVSKYGDKFRYYRQINDDPSSLSSSNVLSLNGDQQGDIWVGTDGNGLNLLDKKTGTFRHFVHNPNDKTSIKSNYVFSISDFDADNLLLTFYRGGFDIFNKKSGKSKHFITDQENKDHFGNASILIGFKEDEENVWLGTTSSGYGLVRYNVKNGQYKIYRPDPKNPRSISGAAVTTILKDNSGQLWFGTATGLCRYDREHDDFVMYQYSQADKSSLSHNSIYALFADSKNNIWIGTANGGLNLYLSKSDNFKNFTEKNGLANNTIFGILEGSNGELWLSTNKGISRFNPATGDVKNYDVADGVQGNQFRFNASYKAKDGEMYFGGTNGFNSFYPDKVVENTFVPPIRLTGFEVFNKPVNQSDPESPISESITEAKIITLPYTQTVFTFKFSALNYTAPEKNRYAYWLKDFDKGWNDIGTKRTVTYTNIDPGEYTFIVKGCNNDGIWNETGTSIKLIITPPFWKTWWFRTLAGAMIIVGLFSIYKLRVASIEKQKVELEHQVFERTREIVAQKEEIESQKESIDEKNAMLENQYLEITAKNQKIMIQSSRIEDAKVEIERKNNELNVYNKELENMVKKKTHQLEKTFEILKESNHELDQFIYRSAHDLKGPIASIIGLCNLGSLETRDPKMLELLSKMEQSAAVLTKKLSRLMKIHEINTLQVNMQKVDTRSLVNEVIEEINLENDCENIRIRVQSTNGTMIDTDKELLKILLKNVIENSIKYKDDEKDNHYVNINISAQPERTVFSVIDNGIGIPKHEANRVFDLFVVATENIKGFGIGLYEAKVIARKLNGDIELKYPESGETEFDITFAAENQVGKAF